MYTCPKGPLRQCIVPPLLFFNPLCIHLYLMTFQNILAGTDDVQKKLDPLYSLLSRTLFTDSCGGALRHTSPEPIMHPRSVSILLKAL